MYIVQWFSFWYANIYQQSLNDQVQPIFNFIIITLLFVLLKNTKW